MKQITSAYKNTIKEFGRELDSIITYEFNGETIELGNEQLNSISPHYEGGILKSVMKVLEIDSNIDIPLETELNYQFGVKVGDDEVQDYRDNYEYINYGNYVVYKSEKQEDTNSFKLICYDKMLYSMKDYSSLNITYPTTIRNYINAIATYMGVTFANASDTFANYDKEIPNELYLSYNEDKEEWESLGYTFRDVLDELAEVTASTICINDDDELEIRYITDTEDTINEEFLKDINVNFGKSYGPINTIVLSRSAGADNIYYPSTLPQNPIELKISDNQIMNGNNREIFMPDIYEKLNGLAYYINDFSSTGITYYDLCDKYNVQIGENIYSCIMLNDDVQITTGLQENIYTDMPEESVTDYTKADTTDRRINQTQLIVDKQQGIIESIISADYATEGYVQSQIQQSAQSITATVSQTYETKSDAQTQYTQIQQTTNSISQTVTNNNTRANIIAKINGNTSSVDIEADNININGIVSANDNFKILSDGSMEAKNGTFKNGNVEAISFDGTNYGITCIRRTIYQQGSWQYIGDDGFKLDSTGLWLYQKTGSGTSLSTLTIRLIDNDGNMILPGKLNAGNIDKGNVWITPVANTPTSVHVNFNKTFTSVPIVVATPESAVIGSTVRGVSVANVTTTGFDLYIYRINTTATNINWIAMN